MAKKPTISSKRVAIDKTNAEMVAIVGIAAFVTVFCLVASRGVFNQIRYQAKVVTAKEKAHQQLEDNIKAYNQLSESYKTFNSASTNVLGGNKDGTGSNDGSNSKIVLDALPPSYDFPALTASIEKVLSDNNLKVSSITGTDDQVNQQGNTSSPKPQAVAIPFSFTVTNANYASISQLITKLQKSIRPIQIDSINVNGGTNNMSLTVNAQTYYQPAKTVNISKQVVK